MTTINTDHLQLDDVCFHKHLVRNDMDINEHERLSNITLKLKLRNSAFFFAVLHVAVWSVK
jgi:hypothetical protein